MFRKWKNNIGLDIEKMVKIVNKSKIPRHIAIIMDGNGRWAVKRGLSRSLGHRAGVEAIRGVVKCCDQIGVEALTVYAFSTENWKRPQTEVTFLMTLLKEYIRNELNELHENNVKICVLGDIRVLPKDVCADVIEACEKTKQNTGLIFNLAINYGGRAEIINAVKMISEDVKNKKFNSEDISEQLFEKYLYTCDNPELELLIRTSGEMRLSNFMLWQVAYAEFVIVDDFWPDFNERTLLEAIIKFQKRDRRFGGINKVEE